jgi:uncharacterized protein
MATLPMDSTADGVRLRVKVVPGCSRTRIAGLLGDRLKIGVAAPPEGGKANAAVCELLAQTLGVPVRQVTVTEGHSRPRKTILIAGIGVGIVAE